MSAWRNNEVTSVHTLPLSRFVVLKAKYCVGRLPSPVSQKAIEVKMQAIITQLILFMVNQKLNEARLVFNLSLMNYRS